MIAFTTVFGHHADMQPMTDYFRGDVLIKRPYIRIEWCQAALRSPLRRETQPEDGRIRHWIWVPELGRFLRVVTLADACHLA